ncbi:condensation domain-containing protein [Actinopolyspora mortivallis]|uniref:Acyltransferase papA2 n=1 Tax=Actinopolyspora mortivallis TaxID=33906 RepID=A0A2T0GV25_ACTMO|nr:condensation domain-containing protein [Actinopolyspora mortivallis]PRW62947.1 acyltransferase papA2 [Actinopolyspora mortivallis]
MKLTEISQYDARTGYVSEWRLHPSTLAAAEEAGIDSRSPSYLQEAHVRTAAMNRQRGVEEPTWLATAFDISGGADPDALEMAFRSWIDRHETLRSGFRESDGELLRFTLETERIALQRVEIGDFADQEELHRYLEDRFDESTDPLDWPCYLFVTVDHEEATTVYMAFDHTNVDGYSISLIAHEIQELYRAAAVGDRAQLLDVGSYVDFADAERARAAELDTDHEDVRRWREFVVGADWQLPAFPLDLGLAPQDSVIMPRQSGLCEWLLDPAEADDFEAACKEGGSNFFSGILAATGIAACELGDQDVYRTLVPFHTRSQPQWWASMGWYVGLAPVELPATQAGDFHAFATRARETVRSVKSMAEVPVARVCELLGVLLRPVFLVSYIDGRLVPGADRWDEWNAHAFGKVSRGDGVFMWINRTQDGVYVTARYPATELGHKNVLRFLARTGEILTTVAQDGDYVPLLAGPR